MEWKGLFVLISLGEDDNNFGKNEYNIEVMNHTQKATDLVAPKQHSLSG